MSKAKKYESYGNEKRGLSDDLEDKDDVCALFYAKWCGFSRRFLPIFEEFSQNNPKECLTIAVDDSPELCRKYSITYYPTVIMLKKGKVKKRLDSKPGIGLNRKQLEEFADNE
jgi:thiol-disulfide isomerase/thioredoxin